MEMNEVLDKLPSHLMSLVIEQPYNDYTSRDHAVWRYVMRQNVKFLSKVAHGSYIEGLKKTGISINTIPHMYGMNRILKEIGWAAVAVDGFIPPSAFMEFQAYKVLVIAADIRPVDQIEYTPAPDIIHEAAGHAPIIADDEYSEYLRFFGEIGSKAFSSARDYELYEAVRHLSILKADPYTAKGEIEAAEKHLAYIDSTMGEPSEMALIRNLHWWTVEYGLIGSLEAPKIYGAGLLSSIGESYNCLQPHIKKIPYTVEAAKYNFDITTQQPHLFVTPDFKHLSDVLNQFADTMALRTGGISALQKAEASANTATVVLDSGIQISGTFHNSIVRDDEVILIRTNSSTALAYGNKEINGHGKEHHKEGFSSPIGKLKDIDKPLHLMSENDLSIHGIRTDKYCNLTFESGINVYGRLLEIYRQNDKNLIFTFEDCTVKYNEEVLFKPSWGQFDMVAGTKVASAYTGPADPNAFKLSYKAPKETTHKIVYNEKDKFLHQQYQKLRDIRDAKQADSEVVEGVNQIWSIVKVDYPTEWLIMLEMLEILSGCSDAQSLYQSIFNQLIFLRNNKKVSEKLVDDGLELITNKTIRTEETNVN